MRIKVKVNPSASGQSIRKKSGNFFQMRVESPPENGKANKEARELLADYFDIGKSKVELVSGEKSNMKYFEVEKDDDIPTIKES